MHPLTHLILYSLTLIVHLSSIIVRALINSKQKIMSNATSVQILDKKEMLKLKASPKIQETRDQRISV